MTDHDLTNEAHRADCEECAATWGELERIARDARALPALSPSRDLWAGIEARIAGVTPGAVPDMTDGSRTALSRRRGAWPARRTLRLAAAAGILVAATATITWQLATRDATPATGFATESGSPAGTGGASLYQQASYEQDFGAMDREIQLLESLVATQRAELDPATVAILERNLTVIDQAIRESREAFLQDPASRFLAVQLARSYSSKLTVLRDMATLPTGT